MTDLALDEMDAAIREKSLAAMPKEIKLLNGTALLTGTKHDRGLNFLAGMLIGRAFNSLWRAREDLLCGYSVQSMALCRAALEDWTTLIWVELHPDRVNMFLWAILSEVNRPAGSPPKYAAMWKELGDLGKIPGVMYDSISKFAHPKSIGLRWLIDFDPEMTNFHYGGHFDQHYLKVSLFHLIQVAQAFGERVARLQFRMLGEVDPEWLKRGQATARAAIRTIDEMYDEFGRGKSDQSA
jgi:hypothetical protein